MGIDISPVEEAKARAFREERFREQAAAFKRRMKLGSEVSGIMAGTTQRPAPVSAEAGKRLAEIAGETRQTPKREPKLQPKLQTTNGGRRA